MNPSLPHIYLARHGETAWSASGQHTSVTDLPLTERGERSAALLVGRLAGVRFDLVLCSPLLRARRTCQLAGFSDRAEIEPRLAEWNYGQYEGLTTPEIQGQRPDWELFRDGCPAGESIVQVAQRAEGVIQRLRSAGGNGLVFSSGHILRVLAARWLGLDAACGRLLFLSTASLSILGYDHNLSEPIVHLWNDARPANV
ncbi:MAG TPA: histidine phosphatase family protein [Pirellulales bacterium]|jgi:probable phosphoglycerate mutase|nr:histidine phosphatase family protein [Pirellulales bacterium]